MWLPSGRCMTARKAPPGRTSIVSVSCGTSTAAVPNQIAKCSGLVSAWKTSSRGARRVRVIVKYSAMGVLLVIGCRAELLKCIEVLVEGVDAVAPESGVVADPSGCRGERSCVESGWTVLGLPPPRHEPRRFEHPKVLRHGGECHVERRRQLPHGRLALAETREDGASCGIGEGRECGAEQVVCHVPLRIQPLGTVPMS